MIYKCYHVLAALELLRNCELQKLYEFFAKYKEIDRVILYGSRAKGNYKSFSDVDITLVGNELTSSHLNRLSADINNSSLAYNFDISILHQLKNPELLDHIQRRGVTLYTRR